MRATLLALAALAGFSANSLLTRAALASGALHAPAFALIRVATGALVLAQAGLLDGLRATTHHGALDRLRQLAPRAEVVDNERFVDNGALVTAAGISAGIDASLHVVGRLLGPAVADATARQMEYRHI